MKDFTILSLQNRLGQSVDLQVRHETVSGRDCIFVKAPKVQASSLVGKNAEPFAQQLLQHFGLNSDAFDLIELRHREDLSFEMLHWRFDWCGHAAMKARSQLVTAERRKNTLLGALVA